MSFFFLQLFSSSLFHNFYECYKYLGFILQCRSYLTRHARPKNITCCREFDLCNQNLFPQLINNDKDEDPHSSSFYGVNHPLVLTMLVVMAFFIITVLLMCYV